MDITQTHRSFTIIVNEDEFNLLGAGLETLRDELLDQPEHVETVAEIENMLDYMDENAVGGI